MTRARPLAARRSAGHPPQAGPDAGWSGLLPVDKPAGITSHDVVHRARRRLGRRDVGHLGTLDPAATGLLVLALGAATRCALVWQGGRKTYAGSARFGVTTDSQDLAGRVLATSAMRPGADDVRRAAAALTGELLQVPPMVSALKRGGERLHVRARRGETVALAPRPIRVDAWRWLAIAADEARFEVDCSGGTYVRTLIHDLGAKLGCGAALASLQRLASEPFTLAQACPWSALESGGDDVLGRFGIPLDRALETLPEVRLDAAAAAAVGRGQGPEVEPGAAPLDAGARSVVFRARDGRALALGELRRDAAGVRAWPAVVFPWAVHEGGHDRSAASPSPKGEGI
jgi:tRNA pseudouridine55 synthase